MKISTQVIWSSILLLSLTGCLVTRDEMNEEETNKQTQAQVTAIQKSKADQENRIYQLQDELRQVSGRVDAVDRKVQDQTVKQNSQTGPSNKDIIDQMKIFEQTLAQMKIHLDELDTKFAALTTAQAAANVAPAVEKSSKKDKEPKFTKDAWAIAEEAYAKKEWKNAILNFQNYRDQNPKGANYPVATYKIGVAFQELKMKDEAKAFFDEVIQKYPKTPSAKKAKFRLSQMK